MVYLPPRGMGQKDIFLSETMALRIQKLDKALRDAGFLSPIAPPISECDDFVRIIVRSRGEDYQAGMSGRTLSTQMAAVQPAHPAHPPSMVHPDPSAHPAHPVHPLPPKPKGDK
jgi:hypothetical protein